MLSKEATPLGDGLEILVGVVAGGSDEFAVGGTECLLGYGTRDSRTSYDRCLRPFEWEGTPRAIRIELMGITNRSFGASAGKRFGSASHFIVVESRGRSLATLSLKALAGTGYPYATTADAASQGRSGVHPYPVGCVAAGMIGSAGIKRFLAYTVTEATGRSMTQNLATNR